VILLILLNYITVTWQHEFSTMASYFLQGSTMLLIISPDKSAVYIYLTYIFNKFVFPSWWLMLDFSSSLSQLHCWKPQNLSSHFMAWHVFQFVSLCIEECVIFHQKYTSQNYKYNINFKLSDHHTPVPLFYYNMLFSSYLFFHISAYLITKDIC